MLILLLRKTWKTSLTCYIDFYKNKLFIDLLFKREISKNIFKHFLKLLIVLVHICCAVYNDIFLVSAVSGDASTSHCDSGSDGIGGGDYLEAGCGQSESSDARAPPSLPSPPSFSPRQLSRLVRQIQFLKNYNIICCVYNL